jgi:hypothetical protein
LRQRLERILRVAGKSEKRQRPRTDSSTTRRSTIETAVPLCRAYQPPTESDNHTRRLVQFSLKPNKIIPVRRRASSRFLTKDTKGD